MNNAEYLWNLFAPELGDIGAAAVLGNLKAESNLNPRNLQNSYEKKLGYTDVSYTNAVDAGTYNLDKFAHDSAGYGLAQWTHWSRKSSLYQNTINLGFSIGDITAQGKYILKELRAYGLTDYLKNCTDLYEATSTVLRKYERPANQTDANCKKRTALAQEFYDTFHKYENKYESIIEELDTLAEKLKRLSEELKNM